MPIIIQETEVQVAPAQGGSRGGATGTRGTTGTGEQSGSTHVVPLPPADLERMQRYLIARQARLRAD